LKGNWGIKMFAVFLFMPVDSLPFICLALFAARGLDLTVCAGLYIFAARKIFEMMLAVKNAFTARRAAGNLNARLPLVRTIAEKNSAGNSGDNLRRRIQNR
jgi:hypothetical protein